MTIIFVFFFGFAIGLFFGYSWGKDDGYLAGFSAGLSADSQQPTFSANDLVAGRWYWLDEYRVRYEEDLSALRGDFVFFSFNHPDQVNNLLIIPKTEIKNLRPG